MKLRLARIACAIVILTSAGLAGIAQAGGSGQAQAGPPTRLCLKDGSYMVVSKFQVLGDRVRYYSVDREEWEEIPKNLVDFNATKQWAEQYRQRQAKLIHQAKKLESQPLVYSGKSAYQVAPGVPLPPGPGVFVYDGIRVIRLVQVPGEEVRDKRRMALAMATLPIVKGRIYVEISGKRSDTRISLPRPNFYIESLDFKPTELQLLSLRTTRIARIVEAIQHGPGLGRSGEIRTVLPFDASAVASGIYKVTPRNPLAPGEYAFGLILGGKLNLDVWDFEIESGPQANAGQQTPSRPKR